MVNYCVWDPEKEHACTIGSARPTAIRSTTIGLPNSLYHNNGDGTFTDVSVRSGIAAHTGKGMGVSFLDFDGDGRLDVFVANDTTPNFLFRNLGDGKFQEVALEAGVAFNNDGRAVSSMGADGRDIDNDGREDLFVTANEGETFPLFRNLGRGLFADITDASGVGRQTRSSTGWSMGIFDFNNDGAKDLFAACGSIDDNVEEFSHRASRQRNFVLANAGAGKFEDVSARAGADFQKAAWNRGAAFGDLDGDGRVDVVVSRIGERAAIFRNTSAGRNHYLAVRLRGRRSNRDGLGAMVHVTGSSGRQQWNRVTTAVGYGSSSDRTVYFGMGQDAVAASVEVVWPGGGPPGAAECPLRSLFDLGRAVILFGPTLPAQVQLALTFFGAAQHQVRLAEHQSYCPPVGIQIDGALQLRRCFGGTVQFEQRPAQFGVGPWRSGRRRYGLMKHLERALRTALADEESAIVEPGIGLRHSGRRGKAGRHRENAARPPASCRVPPGLTPWRGVRLPASRAGQRAMPFRRAAPPGHIGRARTENGPGDSSCPRHSGPGRTPYPSGTDARPIVVGAEENQSQRLPGGGVGRRQACRAFQKRHRLPRSRPGGSKSSPGSSSHRGHRECGRVSPIALWRPLQTCRFRRPKPQSEDPELPGH